MKTLYDLLNVEENATDNQIKESYEKILQKADSLPQSEKLTEQIQRIKIAYGILSNPEKRKKYDIDLATKRADELLNNIQPKQEIIQNQTLENPEENTEKEEISKIDEERIKQQIKKQIDLMAQKQEEAQRQEEEKIRKQKANEKIYKKQEKKYKRAAKKEQQLKREMEIEAYGRYLENQGYKVKYPWTWPRVKRLLISIFAVIIAGFIIWHIPFFRNSLTDLYNENFLIKMIVDAIVFIFKAIIDAIASIFK